MDKDTLPTFFEVHEFDGLISLAIVEHAVQASGLSMHEVEGIVLASGYLPKRYQRSRAFFSIDDHVVLHRSCVAIVGCGGLGGHVAEMLARCGVGRLICIDPDCFVEYDLTWQRFCNLHTLGRPKAKVIAEEMLTINPAVQVFPHIEAFHVERAAELLRGADIVVDALPSGTTQDRLAEAAQALGRPLVYGASRQPTGQLTGSQSQSTKPSFFPPVLAAVQAAETVKILLGREDVTWSGLFSVNLENMAGAVRSRR